MVDKDFEFVFFILYSKLSLYNVDDALECTHYSIVIVLESAKTDALSFVLLRVLLHHLVDIFVRKLNPFENLWMLILGQIKIFSGEILLIALLWICLCLAINLHNLVEVVLGDGFCFIIENSFHLQQFAIHFKELNPKVSVVFVVHLALRFDVAHHE